MIAFSSFPSDSFSAFLSCLDGIVIKGTRTLALGRCL